MIEKSRYFLEILYKGTSYHGWQIQKNAISVQEVVNKALKTYLREEVDTIGCGRTDTGVHANQFFVHFDSSDNKIQNLTAMQSLNALLPHDIAVKRIIPVHADAHARFDATIRSYEYHIHQEKDPFKYGYSWLLRDIPDIELMNEAALIMMKYRDFSCFSKAHTQTFTNNCIISEAEWKKTVNGLVFNISADRFLRNMVRAIVGTLLRIGYQEISMEDFGKIIESKNRSNAGASVPACGLYLTRVNYSYIK
ncbi:MAG TPA: tRNA pseudouridine(38-40) synthase TruA [Sphingobacteriaceae bacterium]|nr:tRNA pseudouridine(38-40) synthase TruA [Sphingobacteriaceae bacterium]